MTQTATHHTSLALLAYLARQNAVPATARLAIGVAVTVTKWHVHARTRRDLRALEPHLLSDIGLSADQARTEAKRRFWDT